MGLLSALGRNGMKSLRSGEMFGGGMAEFAAKKQMLAQQLGANDVEVAKMIMAAQDESELARMLQMLRAPQGANAPRPDISPYAPSSPYSPYV